MKELNKNLKNILDNLYDNRSQIHMHNDPVSFCHKFNTPEDQEIAGLIASSFAYGNVKIILRNLQQIFSKIGDSPRRFAENFQPEEGVRLFAGFKHRFNDAKDLSALFIAIRYMLEKSGSIKSFFLTDFAESDKDITSALTKFTETLKSFDYSPVFGTKALPPDSYFPFLFPSPASGSACKRLCMYLRWMVRPADGIDLGIWDIIHPSKLIIPVDAHIHRISGLLGLTNRKQADWKMAQDITDTLRELDPDDPVKYDFAIAHIGISEGCNGKNQQICRECPIAEVCTGNKF